MVKRGDMVVVHYRGTLKNGKEFDSSEGHEPLQFILGSGSMIPGFEKAVGKMKLGETKTVTLKPAEAYGQIRKDLIMEVKRDRLPDGMSIKPGDKLQMRNSRGGSTEVRVIKTTEDSITVDANHELAGQELTFTLKLIAVTS
jgi:FKBP-type peptidyl-prolyl cis-trans isomerase 2